jgi:hypothetical protein
MWFCQQCQQYVLINEQCLNCKSEPPLKKYCFLCGEYKKHGICDCFYKFTCALCKNNKGTIDKKLCWQCGDVVERNFCQKCEEYVPREWGVCEECYPKSDYEIGNFQKNFAFNFTARPKSCKQCKKCSKFVDEAKRICWSCKWTIEEGICKHCSTPTYLCPSCKTLEEMQIRIHKLTKKTYDMISLQKLEDDWECYFCNDYNAFNVIFCETCNFSRNYSFLNSIKCRFCGEMSCDEMCKQCYWTNQCSVCCKNMLPSQSLFCGHCGFMLDSIYCEHCGQDTENRSIICKNCVKLVQFCDCGNSMHPNAKHCRVCLNKIKPLEDKCFICKKISVLDFCYICKKIVPVGLCLVCSYKQNQQTICCRKCAV